MTTEDDFNAILDADPSDWQCRLVFADWLDERGDPRGPGYRALGHLQFRPHQLSDWWWYSDLFRPFDRHECHKLPRDWYEPMRLEWLAAHPGTTSTEACVDYEDRRAAEDAAALAFARLPAERRAELLAGAK